MSKYWVDPQTGYLYKKSDVHALAELDIEKLIDLDEYTIEYFGDDKPYWERIYDTTDPARQKDIDLLRLPNKQIRIKVSLLDDSYQEAENITGKVKSASYSIDSESDIRRTCTLTLVVPEKDQMIVDIRKTWNRRMVELFCGIYDPVTKQYVWYSLGRMLLRDAQTTYDATTQEVKFSLVDLMAAVTDVRGSQLGHNLTIPEGTTISTAIGAIVAEYSPFKRLNIVPISDTVPYDIEISLGKYPFDALTELLNLYPYYEMLYDEEGKFTVQEIPTKTDDPIDIDYGLIDEALISESDKINFSDVKNTTEIWGKSLDAEYFAISAEASGSCYNLTIDDTFETLATGETYGFTAPADSVEGQSIKIQDTPEHGIYIENGVGDFREIEDGEILANRAYVVKYTQNKFVLQGEYEIHVIVQEIKEMPSATEQARYKAANGCNDVQWVVNADSEFACTVSPTTGYIQGEIKQVLEGGEYDAIYTTELAYERARYENYLKTRLQDNVELDMILIPWMNVNDKIRYTSPTTNTLETYMVNSIDYDFKTWTMTVTASKFFALYPWE